LDAENKRFVYDAENRLKEFFVPTNNTSTPDATYHYDGNGKRVKKISSTETVVFVYDGGGKLVAEYSTQLAETPQVSYLTTDHLGSPRVITDAVGNIIARKDFGAFGDETFTTQRTETLGYKPENIRQDYTGYQKDDESGLEFAQARYYNTAHGRFTSTDPLTASANVKDPQTFNRYTYALNSPYKFTDPLGLKPKQDKARDPWNKDLADFLDRNMVGASVGYRATYEPANSPIVANTSGGHGGNSGSSYGGNGNTAQAADPPALPPLPSDTLTLDYTWWTEQTNGKDKRQVSDEIDVILDKGLSAMTTNIVEAMSAVQHLTDYPGKETSLTLTPGLDKPEVSFTVTVGSIDEVVAKLKTANDKIQALMVAELKSKINYTSGQENKMALGDTPSVAPYDNMAANFGALVRKKSNEAARKIYNETFPERKKGIIFTYTNAYPIAFELNDY